jgi:hypothetical protein
MCVPRSLTLIRAVAFSLTFFAAFAAGLPEVLAQGRGGGGLCLFEHANFDGRRLCLGGGERIPNLAQMDQFWNDRISSVQVPPGMQVTLCEHANFTGHCVTLDRTVVNFKSINLNDRVSSISVEGRVGRGGPPGGSGFDGPRGPEFGRGRGGPRFGADDPRRHMFQLRMDCERGDRRACIRFGIIIGENRERRAQWQRESPDLFWWDR